MHDDFKDDESDFTSKTRLKKEAEALQNLAVYLTTLNAPTLAQIPLDSSLEKAIQDTHNIKQREALRRHHQLLGKLMRKSDHAAITAAVERIKQQHLQRTHLFQSLEQWRTRLIEDDDTALNDFFKSFPNADRQALRTLIKNAKAAKNAPTAGSQAKKLFQSIRDIAEQQFNLAIE